MTRPEPVELSNELVSRRLEQVRALYKLMVSLRSVRVAPVVNGLVSEPAAHRR